ncbi:MAG TPA: DUF3105 domain-containing protein, partial [Pseudonocardiaceae bacterium]|nr:DUF3105 domain-containing protein [Pseudonocardiaceae bacterium]
MRARNALIAAILPALTAVAGCGAGQESYVPTETDQDPARRIPGIQVFTETNTTHVPATERVPYQRFPPTGGPHDLVWAECTGTVYAIPVRNEHMVHSLEHGAVWIAYNPDRVTGKALDTLRAKVEGQPYMLMSPWPDLDRPISLQSWGHQLKLSNADDARIDQFITSLRENSYQNPEPGGRCDSQGTGFDVTNPPPFVPEQPDPNDPNTVTMDGKGAADTTSQEQQGMTPSNGATPPASGASTPP